MSTKRFFLSRIFVQEPQIIDLSIAYIAWRYTYKFIQMEKNGNMLNE